MQGQDSLAERSKVVAQSAIPKGHGFEPHSCHLPLDTLEADSHVGAANSPGALPLSSARVGRGSALARPGFGEADVGCRFG